MSLEKREWLSLTEASERLGIHPNTLRRWTDAGEIPCFRTPGGHRRFRAADLALWMGHRQTTTLALQAEALVQSAVKFTRQEMSSQHVSDQPWYRAFNQEDERQQMRDTGRRLFGLAIQYMGRTSNRAPVLQEGQRIGRLYGQQCAQRQVSLVDTMRAFFFFRESLLRATRPGLAKAGQYDDQEVRIHRQLRHFLDQVMYACLDSYETTCCHLIQGEGAA